MISVKLSVLGDVPLGVWIISLPWLLDCIAHVLDDGFTLSGFDIEGVFGDLS